MDASVYIDVPDAVRLSRRVERDTRDRGRRQEDVVAQYQATVRPMHDAFVEPSRHRAELVVDGTQPRSVCAAAVMTFIARRAG